MGSNEEQKWADFRKKGRTRGRTGRTKVEQIACTGSLSSEINLRCTAMKKQTINWDKVPDVITKEQLFRLCHIGRKTALFLLKSGKIPCKYTGKKTRCYKILKKDVIAYLLDREAFPEYYKAAERWYAKNPNLKLEAPVLPEIRDDLHEYYTYLLRNQPDVMTNDMISEMCGYSIQAINSWIRKNHLQHFIVRGQYLVPKIFFVDFFCTPRFRTIHRKSKWHINALMSYEEWKYGADSACQT